MRSRRDIIVDYISSKGGSVSYDELLALKPEDVEMGNWKSSISHIKGIEVDRRSEIVYFTDTTLSSFNKERGEKEGSKVRILEYDKEQFLISSDIEEYLEGKDENYEQVILANMEIGRPVLLVGPKGNGKTLLMGNIAKEKGHPIIQFDCSEDVKRRDLIGRFMLIGDEVVYDLGVLPRAIELANEYGRAILVFEELNALTPGMQKTLNQLLDWRQQIYVPEINKIYKLKDGAKLLIVGTMNPSTYGGTYELNEDLKSRFGAIIKMGYPNISKEESILERVGDLSDEMKGRMIRLAGETRTNELEYALSTRDLVLFSEQYLQLRKEMSDEKALEVSLEVSVLGKYDSEQDIETMIRRIDSIFGISLGDGRE